MIRKRSLNRLIADCNILGISLIVAEDGGLLMYDPRLKLTPNLIHRIAQLKPEILADLLAPEDCPF